jgi:hypothetical protein
MACLCLLVLLLAILTDAKNAPVPESACVQLCFRTYALKFLAAGKFGLYLVMQILALLASIRFLHRAEECQLSLLQSYSFSASRQELAVYKGKCQNRDQNDGKAL